MKQSKLDEAYALSRKLQTLYFLRGSGQWRSVTIDFTHQGQQPIHDAFRNVRTSLLRAIEQEIAEIEDALTDMGLDLDVRRLRPAVTKAPEAAVQ